MAIFGNYDAQLLKQLFIKASSLLKNQKNTDIKNTTVYQNVVQMLSNLIKDSVYRVTGRRLEFALKHCRDTGTSPADLTKFIDARKCEGKRVRALFIDYLDIMVPSNTRYTDYTDYNSHGIITQELRNIAGTYGIPILTITQGTRESESIAMMSNQNMADSHKKVRYSDYIYMVRLRYDLTPTSEVVKQQILDGLDQNLTFQDLTNSTNRQLIPFEVKITKAKDGAKNMFRFHLFSENNLRIYENLKDVYSDIPNLQQKSGSLSNQIELLSINNISQPTSMNNVGLII